jgi:hypothetical protein
MVVFSHILLPNGYETSLKTSDYSGHIRHCNSTPWILIGVYSTPGEEFISQQQAKLVGTVFGYFRRIVINQCRDLVHHRTPYLNHKVAQECGPYIPKTVSMCSIGQVSIKEADFPVLYSAACDICF